MFVRCCLCHCRYSYDLGFIINDWGPPSLRKPFRKNSLRRRAPNPCPPPAGGVFLEPASAQKIFQEKMSAEAGPRKKQTERLCILPPLLPS